MTGPTGPSGLPQCLGAVTAIASRPEVVEIEPQIRPLPDGHLMIRMQVPLAAIVSVAKLRKHQVRGRRTQAPAPELLHDLRLPSAIDAPPAVPDEAQNPQPAVIRIVSPLGARSAECI